MAETKRKVKDKTGAGGRQFSGNADMQAVYVIGNRVGDVTYVRPWHSDYEIAAKDGIKRDIHVRRETHFGTADENGVARTVTANGIFDESGAMHIDGAGRFVVNAVNTYSGAVSVNDTATLAVNAGKKVTSGAITVGATATLEVAQSGTVALGGNLSLADGATLAFNYTDKTVPVLDATDKTVTFGGTSNIVVKVSAADGKRARGVAEIQPWLTRRLAEHLAKKGRKVIGWEEIVVGFGKADRNGESENKGKPKSALLPGKDVLVMGYHAEPGALAANMGYTVVQSPNWHCYFDYTQNLHEDPFRYFLPNRRWLPIENVYEFDPYHGVKPEARKNVIGGQCCNWTSHTWNRFDLEWKLWPRGFARGRNASFVV